MTRKAFDRIAEGLTEAIAVARGDAVPARMFIPPEVDIRAIRRKLAMSQEDFAPTFGFSLTQIRDWEQGRSKPLEALRAYLLLIDLDPEPVLKGLRALAQKSDAA